MSRNIYTAKDIELINNSFLAPDQTTIFRYMDFSKYMDLLENEKLFFCNTECFKDKFEGVMLEGFFKNWTND